MTIVDSTEASLRHNKYGAVLAAIATWYHLSPHS